MDQFTDASQHLDAAALAQARLRLSDLKFYAAKLRKLYPGHDDIGHIADTIDRLAWGPRPVVESPPKEP